MLVCLLSIIALAACASSQNSSPSSKNNSTSSSKVSEQSKSKNKTDATKGSTVDSSKKSESSEKEQSSVASSQSSSDPQTSPTQGSQVQAVGGQRVRLNVPLIIQRYWNYCAPATVSMMLASRGINVDQAQLASEMGTDESFGTHNSNAIRVLNRYMFGYDAPYGNQAGYRLATVTNPSSDSEDMRLFKQRLIQNINDGYPMYYTFDNSKMYPGRSGEHNVIGVGYVLTADGADVAYVYYLDPSYMVQDPVYGGLKIVSPEELLNAMVTCMEPNYGW